MCRKAVSAETVIRKPQYSLWALISFVASFAVARVFTTLSPRTIMLVGGRFHVHHFWYGIALLAIGGWLGISYESERISRLAAILFGAGGGLIGDEVGLLLTFEDYWTGLTYTIVMPFLALATILILTIRYSRTIQREFSEFSRSNASLYFGVFLVAVSVAFFMETENILINSTAIVLAITACIIILAYFVQRIRRKR